MCKQTRTIALPISGYTLQLVMSPIVLTAVSNPQIVSWPLEWSVGLCNMNIVRGIMCRLYHADKGLSSLEGNPYPVLLCVHFVYECGARVTRNAHAIARDKD